MIERKKQRSLSTQRRVASTPCPETQFLPYLAQIDLFSEERTETLLSLAKTLEQVEFPAHAVIYAEGDAGEDMFILLKGELNITKHNRFITVLNPIDYIGEMALIENLPRSATVVSATPVRLLRLSGTSFHDYLLSNPHALVKMLQTLSRRIRRDTEQLAREYEKANILIHDMRDRMSAFVLLDFLDDAALPAEARRTLTLLQQVRSDLASMSEEALANAKGLRYCKECGINSLHALVEDVRDTLSHHPDVKGKPIVVESVGAIPDIPFDRVGISRVMTNLVINAGQASQTGSPIVIRLSADRERASIAVTDQGCGIPETIKDKVFLPQFTTKPHGHGLGLASCKEIVEGRHGGALHLVSQEGQGTTFRVALPISRPSNELRG
ncbi:MAG: HAMP domain-containing sensor histidine kinase [Verrucomicrobiota bacterium]